MKSKKNIISKVLFIFFLIVFLYSLFHIIKWVIDSTNTKKQIKDINNLVIEKKDNKETKIVNQDDKIPKKNPYWDYIKMNMIDVNFKELKQKNNQVKGWIKVNGTNINYPFVQTSDNKFYLEHSLDKSYNEAGWVFEDYRNSSNDLNTIIYAHGRLDNTMFGTLKNILSSNWFNDTNNYVVKMSTEEKNTLWQVFSIYRIPTTNDYIQINFSSDLEYNNFLNMLINRSDFNFNTSINSNDHILTLSTCYDDNDKVVLHAKLIKEEKKS